MAFFTLPIDRALANYRFETDLDGVTYRIEFKYNARDDSWNCNFLDVAGNVLRAGIKAVTDWSLLERWVDQGRPDGDVFSAALGDITAPASLGELGDKVLLVYSGEG